jgi:hypothetical protein
MVWNPGICGKRPATNSVRGGTAWFTVLKLVETRFYVSWILLQQVAVKSLYF